MLLFILKRLLQIIPTIAIIVTISFFLMKLAPGSPFSSDQSLPKEVLANLDKLYHFNDPVWKQFLLYVRGLLHFDFGPSYYYRGQSVAHLILISFPISFFLGLTAMLFAIITGTILGGIAALYRNSVLDYGISLVYILGIVVPNFVIAPILVLAFSIYWHLLPVEGWHWSPIYAILPVLTLALPQVAYISRLTKSSVIEVMRANFVRTARAKGLSKMKIFIYHILKPSLLPVISYLGPATAAVLTGSVVVETIFNIPGIGRYFVSSALNRDYTMVMGTVIFFAVIIIFFNFLVDILYNFLDPRIKL